MKQQTGGRNKTRFKDKIKKKTKKTKHFEKFNKILC